MNNYSQDNVKMKPIFTQNQMDITFSELQEPLGHHPVIIFYDEYYEEWYYVKVRSAYNDQGIKRHQFTTEIFVPKADKGLLTEDSYIDTTKIYHIKKTELNQYVNKKYVLGTSRLDPEIGIQIYDQILRNLRKQPPFCSVIKVAYNPKNQKFEGFTEYTHPNLLKIEWDNLEKENQKNKQNLYFHLLKNKLDNKQTLRMCEIIYNSTQEERGYYYQEFLAEKYKERDEVQHKKMLKLLKLQKLQEKLEQEQQETEKLKKTRKFKL